MNTSYIRVTNDVREENLERAIFNSASSDTNKVKTSVTDVLSDLCASEGRLRGWAVSDEKNAFLEVYNCL